MIAANTLQQILIHVAPDWSGFHLCWATGKHSLCFHGKVFESLGQCALKEIGILCISIKSTDCVKTANSACFRGPNIGKCHTALSHVFDMCYNTGLIYCIYCFHGRHITRQRNAGVSLCRVSRPVSGTRRSCTGALCAEPAAAIWSSRIREQRRRQIT